MIFEIVILIDFFEFHSFYGLKIQIQISLMINNMDLYLAVLIAGIKQAKKSLLFSQLSDRKERKIITDRRRKKIIRLIINQTEANANNDYNDEDDLFIYSCCA